MLSFQRARAMGKFSGAPRPQQQPLGCFFTLLLLSPTAQLWEGRGDIKELTNKARLASPRPAGIMTAQTSRAGEVS